MAWDRVLNAFFRAARGAIPRLDWYRPFFAKVISQGADGTLDVLPDDPMMPPGGLSGIPIRNGIPGLKLTISAGTSVIVAYENGDPARAYACLWGGGETVTRLEIDANLLVLGGPGGEFAAKGQTLQSYLNSLATALTTHVHGGVTTGAGISAVAPLLASITPPDILATNVQVL